MGGINHQPCNRPPGAYLPHSVRMSRFLSLAHASLETANVHLEDILLAEMVGEKGMQHHECMLNALAGSAKHLHSLRDEVKALTETMRKHGYSDLPTKQGIDLRELGNTFAYAGIVDKKAWEFIAEIVSRGSYMDIFGYFIDETGRLIDLTVLLSRSVTALGAAVDNGEVADVLESNLAGNIKVPFAVLYTAWGQFHRRFLASSMLSTELWYSFNRTGSLVSGAGVNAEAA